MNRFARGVEFYKFIPDYKAGKCYSAKIFLIVMEVFYLKSSNGYLYHRILC